VVTGLNHFLTPDIAVKAAYRIPDSLDVRRAAVSREYLYRIWNSPVPSPLAERYRYRVGLALDERVMDAAARMFVGTHDMAAFGSSLAKTDKSTVRIVYEAGVSRQGEEVTFRVVGNSFLAHQMRNSIGALIRVGLGRMSLEEFGGLMETKKPGSAGPAAPGKGLCLVKINYLKNLGDYNEDL
jgi:tRNA pseudouridine38-40 synthase